ncbi:MAG: chemotaxis protein CheA [Candidatus Goldbacteria bacterium]|nr:chemotaxis protein CheA [Candidatus Goldiibacteriota bacterium]
MNIENYKDVFLEEAEENIKNFNISLVIFEKNTDDLTPLNELFRIAHTIKGMAATMGYDRLTEFTHNLEEILDNIRNGSLPVSRNIINILYKSIDAIQEFIENIKEKNSDFAGNTKEIMAAIRDVLKYSGKKEIKEETKAEQESPEEKIVIPENVIEEAHSRGLKVYIVKVYVSHSCTFKNVRAFMIVRNLSEKGEIINSIPSSKNIEDGNFEKMIQFGFVSKLEIADIEKAVMKISEIEKVEVFPVEKPVQMEKNTEEISEEETSREKKISAIPQNVRINVEKIDALMNLVGELVITKIRLDQITKEKKFQLLREAVDEFDRIINQLQTEVTDVRMLPVSHIFEKYPRIIRDLAVESEKEIDCEIVGGDIELDRTVLEEINEPLLHLVRNAVSHGIETPEQREIAGKPKKGLIKIEAKREKNSVLIEVSDDGRGISLEKVRKKAIEKNIITEERAKYMNDDEIINLIAIPGFSTSEKVDKISGRGVGVDVVKTKVERFGGLLKIESYEGEGSKFIMKLPLTLAIIQSLLIKSGKSTFALPVTHVAEILEINRAELKKIQKKDVIILRGEIIQVVPLCELLHRKKTEEKEIMNLVVVESRDKRIAIEVDEVLCQQEIAIKSLGDFSKYAKGFSGVTILGDGSISLILDIQALLEGMAVSTNA